MYQCWLAYKHEHEPNLNSATRPKTFCSKSFWSTCCANVVCSFCSSLFSLSMSLSFCCFFSLPFLVCLFVCLSFGVCKCQHLQRTHTHIDSEFHRNFSPTQIRCRKFEKLKIFRQVGYVSKFNWWTKLSHLTMRLEECLAMNAQPFSSVLCLTSVPYICMSANIDPLIKIAFSVGSVLIQGISSPPPPHPAAPPHSSGPLNSPHQVFYCETISNLKFVLFMVWELRYSVHSYRWRHPKIRVKDSVTLGPLLCVCVFIERKFNPWGW